MWLSGTGVPQVVKWPRSERLFQPVFVDRIKDRIAEDVATGETALKAREESAGRVLSAWKDLWKWRRLCWWKEESSAAAAVWREHRRLTAESTVRYSRLCELFAENQLILSSCAERRLFFS